MKLQQYVYPRIVYTGMSMNLDFEIFSAIRFLLHHVFTLTRSSERESSRWGTL